MLKEMSYLRDNLRLEIIYLVKMTRLAIRKKGQAGRRSPRRQLVATHKRRNEKIKRRHRERSMHK